MDPFDREDCFLSICSNPTFLGDSIDELEEFFRVHGFWNLDLESLEKTSGVEELTMLSLTVIFILIFKCSGIGILKFQKYRFFLATLVEFKLEKPLKY